jgi:cystathionine beta-lyase/cystathionine gamma-synthase
MNKKAFNTQCIHGDERKYDTTGAVSVPIYQSATFAHPSVGESTGFDYSRLQNPTREHLENTIAQLEAGHKALAFSTGMAAVTTLMTLFEPGDHIIASDDLYGGSHRLFHHISMKYGIRFSFSSMTDPKEVETLIEKDTKGIFIESPTNPMMQVTDLRQISQLGKAYNLLVMVDNTFLTPYYQRPLELGADVVIHSGTKYLGGHNDTLAGLLVVKDEALHEKLSFYSKTIGACLSPFDSWLIIRGIKTLPVRMDYQQKSAIVIANWLREQKQIKKVYYIGLEDHPGYAISKSQASGFGGMISFEVASESLARQILEKVQVIQYAESLGGVETLMTYPMLQTHGDIPKPEREAKGINERLLRLSVGLESVEDLLEDLKQAMEVGSSDI